MNKDTLSVEVKALVKKYRVYDARLNPFHDGDGVNPNATERLIQDIANLVAQERQETVQRTQDAYFRVFPKLDENTADELQLQRQKTFLALLSSLKDIKE